MNKILQGDVLEVLKTLGSESVDCIITSPPYYGLRDYGVRGQIGLEPTLKEYLDKMLLITTELKRVLKKTGTMWWNHGDSYATARPMSTNDNGKTGTLTGGAMRFSKIEKNKKLGNVLGNGIAEKSLLLQAHRLAIRMVDEQGWILRNQIIWHKPNVMPSSVKDRFTVDFEPLFFFSKSKQYYFETQYEPISESTKLFGGGKDGWGKSKKDAHLTSQSSIRNGHGRMGENELGRNKRTVWKVTTKPFKEAHFATFPETLIETPIKAGCPEGGLVLDPFFGAGTTGVVAKKLGRNYLGIELNPEYIKMAETRLGNVPISLFYEVPQRPTQP